MNAPRSLAEITAEARKAPCQHCTAEPLEDCFPGPSLHVVRFAAAYRQGVLTESEFMTVLDAMDAFTALASFGKVA